MINRPEIESLKAGKNALELYISSLKSQNLPGLYLGSTFTFASTPIRPRQPNPFIQTPENTINAVVGFTIRQNLNFFQTKTNLERSRIELRRVDYLRNAVSDGIILEINNAYREANVVSSKGSIYKGRLFR
jgi:Outer membrane efflux protein.